MDDSISLKSVIDDTSAALRRALQRHDAGATPSEIGTATYVGKGIARVRGLPGVRSEELIRFPGDVIGMAFNLDPDEVGVVLLDRGERIGAGCEVRRTGRLLDTRVGHAVLGRVLNATAEPLDGRGPVRTAERRAIEREAPRIMDRLPVEVPLQTGIKAIDALIPVGRGQRELILGDRQTGKTAIAVDAIINQRDQDVVCIYCAIGQRSSAVAKVIAELRRHDATSYTVVVVATGEDTPGQQFIAPFAATTMGEWFAEQGRDVLIVYDDLTRHARAYRELSLLLRRPPGREAYPGDIFYLHSRLLERSTRLSEELGGGSLTALPIIETEAQNLSAYIPTNLISITDGQIYLAPELLQKAILPAVDIGKSVSRVGGKAQLPAYQSVAGELRLSYAQFEELEAFSRFGARLDDETARTLERGRRVREALKQPQYEPLPPAEQVAVLLAATEGVLDDVGLDEIAKAEASIRRAVTAEAPAVCNRITAGERLTHEEREQLLDTARRAIHSPFEDGADGDA
jgi:F-type H+-transporting ATPase subunit alpha